MVVSNLLPDLVSQPLGSFTQHLSEQWPVLMSTSMSVGASMLLAMVSSWLVFRFLYERKLAQVPVLKERLALKDGEVEKLQAQLSARAPTFFGVFEIEQTEWVMYWKERSGKELYPFHPDVLVPCDAVRVIQIMVKIFAMPHRFIEDIYLELVEKHSSLPKNCWRSQCIGHYEQFFYFHIPDKLSPGCYTAKLIIRSRTLERTSPPFDVDVLS